MYYHFYQAFEEENLSLAPHQTDVFRFSCEQVMSPGIVITLTPKEIIVKKGNQDNYYEYVGNALTELEELLAQDGPGRRRKLDPVELLHCIRTNPGRNQSFYKAEVARMLQCAPNTVQNALKVGVAKGWIRFEEDGQEKLYRLTGKGEQRAENTPSTVDWTDQ